MSHRKLISIVAASALAVTTMTSTPARADNDDFGKFVAGAAALAIIGIALSQKSKKSKDYNYVSRSHSNHGYHSGHNRSKTISGKLKHGYGHNSRGYSHHGKSKGYGYRFSKALPARCRTTIYTKYGDRRGYRRGCLHKNYAHFNALPHKCAISGHTYNGARSIVYERRCIRRHGYFTAGEG
ncbi:MAG: hypothetical protein AAF066_17010 [Pseudomonadota bacterium]